MAALRSLSWRTAQEVLLRPLCCPNSSLSPPRTAHHTRRAHSSSLTTPFPDAVVECRGDLPYGSREYLLLPPHTSLMHLEAEPDLLIASLHAHRNILFAASLRDNNDTTTGHPYSLSQVVPALVQAALVDATSNGEQPQAVAALHGLSAWVRLQLGIVEESAGSDPNTTEHVAKGTDATATSSVWLRDLADVELQAVRAIATGIPRPGHSVVGAGTYRDGADAWSRLAKAYAEAGLAEEARLYEEQGGQLVNVEHMADTQPAYLQEAGGAMARFFFV